MPTNEERLRAALLLILDQVDYMHRACALTEAVGAVLPAEVLDIAHKVLEETKEPHDDAVIDGPPLRVIEDEHGFMGIYETHFDEDGSTAWCLEEPSPVVWEAHEEIEGGVAELKRFHEALRFPVIHHRHVTFLDDKEAIKRSMREARHARGETDE